MGPDHPRHCLLVEPQLTECAHRALLHSQAFPGLSRHGRDAATRAAVHRFRGLLADHLLASYQVELEVPPQVLADLGQLSIGDAIIGQHVSGLICPEGCLQASARHLAGAVLLLRQWKAMFHVLGDASDAVLLHVSVVK
jgi:hypothetical protein